MHTVRKETEKIYQCKHYYDYIEDYRDRSPTRIVSPLLNAITPVVLTFLCILSIFVMPVQSYSLVLEWH